MSTLGFCIIIFLFSGSLPSTTLYYKACTNYFPVLLCTTKLAKTTSQHYFVLQSLHKLIPSTTLYYKACKNYFAALLCTTKLAKSTSQYYFVKGTTFAKHTSPRHNVFFLKQVQLCQMPVETGDNKAKESEKQRDCKDKKQRSRGAGSRAAKTHDQKKKKVE